MRSNRLSFEKFQEEDFDLYYQLLGDILVMKMITGKEISKAEAKVRFEKILTINENNDDTGYFAIYNNFDKDFIGLAKLVKTGPLEAEIGYMLIPEFWGKGYGTEVSNTLVTHAKNSRRYKSVVAVIDPANLASKRILQKNNFLLHEAIKIDNLPAEIYRLKLKQRT